MKNSESAALRRTLDQLSDVLDSDVRLVLNPRADDEGHLLHEEELIAAAERGLRTLGEVAAASEASVAFSATANSSLADLRAAALSLEPLLRSAVECARLSPSYVEDFFICLGPFATSIENGLRNLASIISRVESDLRGSTEGL